MHKNELNITLKYSINNLLYFKNISYYKSIILKNKIIYFFNYKFV